MTKNRANISYMTKFGVKKKTRFADLTTRQSYIKIMRIEDLNFFSHWTDNSVDIVNDIKIKFKLEKFLKKK